MFSTEEMMAGFAEEIAITVPGGAGKERPGEEEPEQVKHKKQEEKLLYGSHHFVLRLPKNLNAQKGGAA